MAMMVAGVVAVEADALEEAVEANMATDSVNAEYKVDEAKVVVVVVDN